MEFRQEGLVDREIEIAGYLIKDLSFKQISEITGLSKKLLVAHIRNMMKKLKAADMEILKKTIQAKQ